MGGRYVDGVFRLEGDGVLGATSDAVHAFQIGYGSVGAFSGSIDEVQIYRRALSDAEIAGIYAGLQ